MFFLAHFILPPAYILLIHRPEKFSFVSLLHKMKLLWLIYIFELIGADFSHAFVSVVMYVLFRHGYFQYTVYTESSWRSFAVTQGFLTTILLTDLVATANSFLLLPCPISVLSVLLPLSLQTMFPMVSPGTFIANLQHV